MKKFIIVSASVVVLAFIVGFSLFAQSKSERSSAIAIAQIDEKTHDSCQKCPELSQCIDDNSLTDTTCTKAGNVDCDKTKGCKMKSCHQSGSGCKQSTCDKSKGCCKQSCHKSSKCQEMMKDSVKCHASTSVNKECKMKSCGNAAVHNEMAKDSTACCASHKKECGKKS